jgi:DNA-binding NtrC family response regulator
MARNDNRQDSIMLVDDDPDLCVLVGHWLEEEGYRVEVFPDGESCLAGLARLLPDCICLDLQLPGLSGLETLERVKAHHPRLPVVVLTADSNVETVVSTVQAGAHDYLVKPIDRPKLLTTLNNAIEHHRLSMRLAELEREVEGSGYAGLVGRSPAMKALFRQMDRVASSDITVLIRGESGTGKELVARALHENSGRRDGTFVPVNCAAIPETLEESEFFGHEKGSFTGATGRRTGHIEQAHRGTLFLDEIGELSMGLQAKLLRVLQERRFQRVGGSNELSSDFRLIAATHRDLEAEVRAGRFREDLFFRVAVFELDLPPLRDRDDDVQILADRFLDDFARREDGDRPELTEETRRVLRAYLWPGNVRELQNAMDRARLVAREGRVRPRDLPRRIVGVDAAPRLEPEDAAVAGNGASADGVETAAAEPVKSLEEIERDAIAEALERTGGNLSEVVRQLGIGRTTLYRKLKKYGLR